MVLNVFSAILLIAAGADARGFRPKPPKPFKPNKPSKPKPVSPFKPGQQHLLDRYQLAFDILGFMPFPSFGSDGETDSPYDQWHPCGGQEWAMVTETFTSVLNSPDPDSIWNVKSVQDILADHMNESCDPHFTQAVLGCIDPANEYADLCPRRLYTLQNGNWQIELIRNYDMVLRWIRQLMFHPCGAGDDVTLLRYDLPREIREHGADGFADVIEPYLLTEEGCEAQFAARTKECYIQATNEIDGDCLEIPTAGKDAAEITALVYNSVLQEWLYTFAQPDEPEWPQ